VTDTLFTANEFDMQKTFINANGNLMNENENKATLDTSNLYGSVLEQEDTACQVSHSYLVERVNRIVTDHISDHVEELLSED